MNKVSQLLVLLFNAIVLTACIAAPVCADTFTIKASPTDAAFVITGNDVNYANAGITPRINDTPRGQDTVTMSLARH